MGKEDKASRLGDAENSSSVHQCQIESRDRVLSEVEKNSSIALPGKQGYNGLMPPTPKTVSQLGEFGKEFYRNGFQDGVVGKDQGLCRAYALYLVS